MLMEAPAHENVTFTAVNYWCNKAIMITWHYSFPYGQSGCRSRLAAWLGCNSSY